MIGYAITALVAGSVGVVVAAMVAASRRAWPVACGHCATEARQGGRRQLYVELWDGAGMQYKQWPVGHGELRISKPVGPWLTGEIAAEVRRLEAFQRGAPVAPTAQEKVEAKFRAAWPGGEDSPPAFKI